ncbi:NAD-dependent epimerase/dehydratase family protein [Salegentibacter sp. LM13S]|uniref:NAD-dependent epimerase/dehydratase family protein n=1 Tax=Salegentibacter lacus TaxID=2873599 RepID=UPI001CCB325F|nr:NAD-dependent epimerase/dehydratase family protein [Salegentibacter lacus]MBZ9630846.1 NAD-dependent epimerase/dehydratase family protein [Salegentibacter lacus]
MEKILITGAAGQLGVELTNALISKYGANNILASDINAKSAEKFQSIKFIPLDATDTKRIAEIVASEHITQIYHLAAILSAKGEDNPLFTWELNMKSLLGVLEAAKNYNLKVFWPSSIAVFGKDTPRENTPQNPPAIPSTVYGISKQAGEQWCNYYAEKFNVDIRSVRYPGLISYSAPPGGGTTDYAVEIFYEAKEKNEYNCFLKADTRLPMMYMPDAVRAAIELMSAPASRIKTRTSYNVAGVSFTPDELTKELKGHLPEFKISYTPDFRQKIADSWPTSINDQVAKTEWEWTPKYNLARITEDMLKNIK